MTTLTDRARPEDIPEDVMQAAQHVAAQTFNAYHDDDGGLGLGDPVAIVARAILAAEKRGAAREREECEELEQLFEITHAADMRAVAIWRQANPGNDLVLPDHVDLATWLMDRLDEAADALDPFAQFLPTAEGFVERAAVTPGASPIMPAVKDFRLAHFRAAAAVLAAIRNRESDT